MDDPDLEAIARAGLEIGDAFEPINSPDATAFILGTFSPLFPPQPVTETEPVPPAVQVCDPWQQGRLRGLRTGWANITKSNRRRLPPTA
jgi:hypothetical protein